MQEDPSAVSQEPCEKPAKRKKQKPRLKFGLWPIISTESEALWAARQGAGAALFCAIATAGIAVWSHYSTEMARHTGLNLLALLDASLFAAVAVGIYFNSRFAAVTGLLLYLLERLSVSAEANLKALAMIVILVLCYISGVRGTFAVHRHRQAAREQPGAPIVP